MGAMGLFPNGEFPDAFTRRMWQLGSWRGVSFATEKPFATFVTEAELKEAEEVKDPLAADLFILRSWYWEFA